MWLDKGASSQYQLQFQWVKKIFAVELDSSPAKTPNKRKTYSGCCIWSGQVFQVETGISVPFPDYLIKLFLDNYIIHNQSSLEMDEALESYKVWVEGPLNTIQLQPPCHVLGHFPLD